MNVWFDPVAAIVVVFGSESKANPWALTNAETEYETDYFKEGILSR